MVAEGVGTWAPQDEFWRDYEMLFWFAFVFIQLHAFLVVRIWYWQDDYKERYWCYTHREGGIGWNRERVQNAGKHD